MWTCPKCAARVDRAFDVCWRCGTSAAGEEDPAFIPADLADRIDDPPDAPEAPPAPGDLDGDAAELPEVRLAECYWALSPVEAKFIADRLCEEGIPAAADVQNLRYMLAGIPAGPYFGPRVWVRADDEPRARAFIDAHHGWHMARYGLHGAINR
jgi:hypothetical protein